jgi:hypothetical protein
MGSLEPRLDWFRAHAGFETDFPEPLITGELLATHAKGIYKPADSDFALSIRIQIDSKYDDGIFVPILNNGWAFAYHQETDKRLGNNLFTNRALDLNILHNKPIGVLQQIENSKNRRPRYFVHGLAIPIHKTGDHYILCDESTAANFPRVQIVNAFLLANANIHLTEYDKLSELNLELQIPVIRSIIARQGQGRFRKDLITAYEGKCAITGENTLEVLDAAHIKPYGGQHTNTVSNGILLRTDLHNLFDFNLLAINPMSLKVKLHPIIESNFYRQIENTDIRLPGKVELNPNIYALQERWEIFQSF